MMLHQVSLRVRVWIPFYLLYKRYNMLQYECNLFKWYKKLTDLREVEFDQTLMNLNHVIISISLSDFF